MAKAQNEQAKKDLYQKEKEHNEFEYTELIKRVEPWLWSLRHAIITTGVDYTVIMQIVRAMVMIGLGSKYGEITVKIENNVVTFIYGNEATRINCNIFIKDTGLDKFGN